MEFFDCNVGYGLDAAKKALMPVRNVETLQAEMKRAGIGKALVYRIEQARTSAVTGNRLLTEDISVHDNLYGVWALLPTCTGELPEPKVFAGRMAENRVFAWRMFPGIERFRPSPRVMGDWMACASDRRIPFFYSTSDDRDIDAVFDIATAFPKLRLVFSFENVWPNDRLLRPLLETFTNIHLDLSSYFIDGGIEELVAKYGSSRLLFGSGFPGAYFGHNMLLLRHCGIPEKDRELIAYGNLDRLTREVKL